MLKVEEIKKIIVDNNKNIRPIDASMIANYITSLYELDIVKDESIINTLINKACYVLEGVIYYDSNDKEFMSNHKDISKDNKGFNKNNIIYINSNQSNEMIIITFFHELTHFLQTYYIYGKETCVGIMQDYKYRLLMEAQTQNVAEMVFAHVFGKEKEQVDYRSEDLRMNKGARIRSNLRNYQLYDFLLKELCVVLGITVNEFISMNFNGKKSTKQFETMIKNLENKDSTLGIINELLDVIYSSDIYKYVNRKKHLKNPFNVESLIDKRTINISSINQMKYMQMFEQLMFNLTKNDDIKRAILLENESTPGLHKSLLKDNIKTKRLD